MSHQGTTRLLRQMAVQREMVTTTGYWCITQSQGIQSSGQPEEEVKVEAPEPGGEPEEPEITAEAHETLDLRCSLQANKGFPAEK